MSDIVDMSSDKPPSTSPRSEFVYRTHLVIYNFLRLVPSSVSSSPTDDVVESPVLFTPLSSQDHVSRGSQEGAERGGGDACSSGNAESDGNRSALDRQSMFAELRSRVLERDREASQKVSQKRKVLHELVEKVSERDRRIAASVDQPNPVVPAVTIFTKNNTLKFPLKPASSSPAVDQKIPAKSSPTAMPIGDTVVSDSPFGEPQRTSTPAAAPQNVFPPLEGETEDLNGDCDREVAADRTSSSESDSSSAYIDIDMVDDIESLVSAGVVPSVSKPLKDEISLCWQNLERSRSSKF